jgi:hypothetical protein
MQTPDIIYSQFQDNIRDIEACKYDKALGELKWQAKDLKRAFDEKPNKYINIHSQ